jgi:hypothetical protein
VWETRKEPLEIKLILQASSQLKNSHPADYQKSNLILQWVWKNWGVGGKDIPPSVLGDKFEDRETKQQTEKSLPNAEKKEQ